MYFHVSILILCFSHSSGLSQYCPLDNWIFVLCFLFVWKCKGLFLFAYCPFFPFSPWCQNGMSLALKAYPTYRWTAVLSKIKFGVLSVLVSQPALEGHLVAEHWKAWPCEDACHHSGGWLVLPDSSVHWFFFLFFLLFYIYFWSFSATARYDTKDPSLREHSRPMNLVPFLNWLYLPSILILNLSVCFVFSRFLHHWHWGVKTH